jgi:DNA-binding XRE family transcriptional regulator
MPLTKGKKRGAVVAELTPEERAREERTRERYRRRPLRRPRGTIRGRDFWALIHLCNELRRLREDAGLTLAQVAEKGEMDEGSLSKLENGKTLNPTINTLFRVAEAVGACLDLKVCRPSRERA